MQRDAFTLRPIFAIATCFMWTTHASAQEIVTLKFAMAVPATHYTAVAGGKFFMDRAVVLSNGKIKFEWYPGEQLGKARDLLALVQSGVADIADVAPSYVPDKLPLMGVAELPGQIVNSCEGTKVSYVMTRPGKVLAKDFDAQKVRVLMAATLAPYQILTSKKPVQKLEDLAGLKIRSSGGTTEATMHALGAVPVRLSGPEIREAVTRGTVDGALYAFLSLKPFGLTDSVKYAVEGPSFGTATTTFVMNVEKFKQLPADIQKALEQAGKEAGDNYCNYIDSTEASERRALTGIQSIQLSATEITRWNALLNSTKKDWAKRMQERGRPGSDALVVWDEEMRKLRGSKKSAATTH